MVSPDFPSVRLYRAANVASNEQNLPLIIGTNGKRFLPLDSILADASIIDNHLVKINSRDYFPPHESIEANAMQPTERLL
jgi:hypothetical protein